MSLDLAWLGLSLLPHVGHKTIQKLRRHFSSNAAILQASIPELMQVSGIGQKIATSIHRINLDHVAQQVTAWQAQGVVILPQSDARYPSALRDIPDPPMTLFGRGAIQPHAWQQAVAIVGTRQPSTEAQVAAARLAVFFAHAGWVVVSGLALGVDSAAHIGAVDRANTPPLAVLGSGVLHLYPPENRHLAHRIMQQGALLSESAPDAAPTAARLVARNRIISGLCQHVIVIESEQDGGAMYAARAARRQQRQLYTIDWAVSGNQALLRDGAIPVDPHHPHIPPLREQSS